MSRTLPIFVVLFILGMVAVIAAAYSAPPPNANPELAPFFQSLQQPGTGASCCNLADCRSLYASHVRVGPHGWQALIEPETFPGATETKWVDVPNEKIVRGKSHPEGLASMCWTPSLGVLCFTEPAGV